MTRIRAFAVAMVTAASTLLIIISAKPVLADGPPGARTTPADVYAYTPPPEQLFYNWSGVYFGGHAGGAWGNDSTTLVTVASERVLQRGGDFIGGAQAGYMHQFRDLVLGAEVKYSWTGSEFNYASGATPGLNVSTRVKDITTVTGRLGYAYMNWLAYWKAGWATAGLDYVASGAASGSASVRGSGWVAGAGLSYAFGPRIIGGLEYDYVRVNPEGATVVPGTVSLTGTGLDMQSVTLRLDFKFGH